MFNNFFSCVWSKCRRKRSECLFLKICNKFTKEHPCRSEISKKLLCKFLEIALRHGCSPVTLLHIFRTPLPENTSGWLLLYSVKKVFFLNFAKFTGKLLCQSLFFNKVVGWSLQLYQKEALAQVLSGELYKNFKNNFFLKNTSGGCFCSN